ncbi:hypothetical protein [Halomicrobium sp. LC1Hm]|uniref:hypothetical protein n=1 Tax=Halomicrobium sp. LC1Hm TaxID=2610902 RepID=UPI0012982E71|nr:hypothetical protein [Halomicrobium sp. LC1Hm]QGA82003.1 hypothetical protein LC1Hm_0941 [Halomicrobium sp. LC1Hm]
MTPRDIAILTLAPASASAALSFALYAAHHASLAAAAIATGQLVLLYNLYLYTGEIEDRDTRVMER